MKPKKGISTYILLAGIMGLTIVGTIVAFEIYKSLTKDQMSAEQNTLVKPLDGVIKQDLLIDLENRRKFGQNELARPSQIKTESLSVVGTSSPSAQPIKSPNASSEAERK